MNIIKQEWKFYMRPTLYWSIGMLLLLFISFYKMDGLSSVPGGIEKFMKSLPPVFQLFFGDVSYISSALGSYRMIHLYLLIALALHAIILGSNIFAREEQDKTYEFLYVKGVKRSRILFSKIFAGVVILLFMDVICLIGTFISVIISAGSLDVVELFPYIGALFMTQLFFFSLALLLSVVLKHNQKAGMIGCCIVFGMFMISMYVKMGGSAELIDSVSIFHYADASYVKVHTQIALPMILILLLSLSGFLLTQVLHERRDLL